MILPTVSGRIASLDFLRGVAILGILLANIYAFAMPMDMSQGFAIRPGDRLIDGLTMGLVSGKFRSMLAMLFGVGMYLQFVRRRGSDAWPGGYLKRTAWLTVIGIVHGILIWYGDILFSYSITAFLACIIVEFAGEKAAKWIAGIFGVLIGLASIAFVVYSLVSDPGGGGQNDFFSSLMSPEREIAVYATGTYWEQLVHRLVIFAVLLCALFFLVPALLPLMLIGFMLGKNGVLASPRQHPKTRNALLIVGLGVGVPLNLAAGIAAGISPSVSGAVASGEMLLGPLMACGYLILGAMIVEKGAASRLVDLLNPVGKMALSVYLAQSLICTAIFYSWGLGLFGKLTAPALLGVVASVWTLVIAFAHLWLRRFALGPVEWLWRSLTEGRRLPNRRDAYVVPTATGPAPEPLTATESL